MGRVVLSPVQRVALARHARLRFDKLRDRWILLVPEKVMVPDAICVEILQLCDGARSIGDIVNTLSKKYVADPGIIEGDVLSILQSLADKSCLQIATAAEGAA